MSNITEYLNISNPGNNPAFLFLKNEYGEIPSPLETANILYAKKFHVNVNDSSMLSKNELNKILALSKNPYTEEKLQNLEKNFLNNIKLFNNQLETHSYDVVKNTIGPALLQSHNAFYIGLSVNLYFKKIEYNKHIQFGINEKINKEINGWLNPDGICFFVTTSFEHWAMEYFQTKPFFNISKNIIDAGLSSSKQLYDMNWVKITIDVTSNTIIIGKSNIDNLTMKQKRWIINSVIYEVTFNNYELKIDKSKKRLNKLKVKLDKTSDSLYESYELIVDPMPLYSEIMYGDILNEISFKQLLQVSKEKSDTSRFDRAKHINTRSLRVNTNESGERWLFSYKSLGSYSTTGMRHQGYIQFLKEDISNKENFEDIDCKVLCSCPDYHYRWEYNNVQIGAGEFCDKHNKQPPKDKPQGVGLLGEGLCIAKGELVSTSRGLIPIEDVKIGDKVWTLEGWKSVLNSGKTGNKKVVKLILKSGKVLLLTENHKVLSFSEKLGFAWIEANKLNSSHFLCNSFPYTIEGKQIYMDVPEYTGDKLYYPSKKIILDETLAELMGYMISEGSKHGIFSNFNEQINIDFYNKWCNIFGDKSCIKRSEGCYVGSHGSIILEKLGFINGSYFKEVPTWILEGSRSIIIAFLRGCYAGDGNFRNKHSTYASVSYTLAKNIQLLLHSLNVFATLKCYKSGVNKSLTWVVRTSSKEETEKLYSCLNPLRGYSSYNQPIYKQIQKHFSHKNYLINNLFNFFENICKKTILSSDKINEILFKLKIPKYNKYKIHKNKIIPIIENSKLLCPEIYNELSLLTREDIMYDPIKTIVDNGMSDVYDLTVEEVEHFMVNGIVVHNCKHLIALGSYLKKEIDPTEAPTPEKNQKTTNDNNDHLLPSQKKAQSNVDAPTPDDKSQLTENISTLYKKIENFIRTHPEFDVPYE